MRKFLFLTLLLVLCFIAPMQAQKMPVVGYYPVYGLCDYPPQNWGWWNTPYTHIIFFHSEAQTTAPYFSLYAGSVDSLIFETGVGNASKGWCLNPWDNGTNGKTHQKVILDSSRAYGVRMIMGLVAVGNQGTNSPLYYVISDPVRRHTFIAQAIGFIRRHGYSGMDINWEYAVNTPQARADFDSFCNELRDSLNTFSPRGTLSYATSSWYYWNVNGNGSLTGIGVMDGGSGYTSVPTVTISGNATAVARIANGKVVGVDIISPGSGYYYPAYPTITFTGGGGSGAKALAAYGTNPVVNMANLKRNFDWVMPEQYGMQGSTVGGYSPLYQNGNGGYWDDPHGLNEWIAAGLPPQQLLPLMPGECLKRSSASGAVGTPASGATWIGYGDIPQAVLDAPIYDPISKGSWGWAAGSLYMFLTPQTIADIHAYVLSHNYLGIGVWEMWRGSGNDKRSGLVSQNRFSNWVKAEYGGVTPPTSLTVSAVASAYTAKLGDKITFTATVTNGTPDSVTYFRSAVGVPGVRIVSAGPVTSWQTFWDCNTIGSYSSYFVAYKGGIAMSQSYPITIAVADTVVIPPPPASLPFDFTGLAVGTIKTATLTANTANITSAVLNITTYDIDDVTEMSLKLNGTAIAVPASLIGNNLVKTASISIPVSSVLNGNNALAVTFNSNLNGTTSGFRVDAASITVIITPPPTIICFTPAQLKAHDDSVKATVICPPTPVCDTLSPYTHGYTKGFADGKASVICPPVPVCPDTTGLFAKGAAWYKSLIPNYVNQKITVVKDTMVVISVPKP